jgi:hypothetical protein
LPGKGAVLKIYAYRTIIFVDIEEEAVQYVEEVLNLSQCSMLTEIIKISIIIDPLPTKLWWYQAVENGGK